MAGKYLLGVDVGSMGMKTALVDLAGKIVARTTYEYPILHPEPGAAEHDVHTWLRALKKTTSEVLHTAGISPRSILGVGIDCLCPSLICMDRNGEPLHPSIFFMDRRSIHHAAMLEQLIGGEDLFRVTGNRVAPSAFSAPILLWLMDSRPEVFARTHKFVHANGFLAHYLTGRYTMDWTNASLTQLFDVGNRSWDTTIVDRLGVPMDKLPDLVAPWEPIGEVHEQAAAETGLAPGTLVVGGGADTACAALGLGCVGPGDSIDDAGTATKLAVTIDAPRFIKETMNRCHVVPDRWLLVAPSSATGAALRWFREQFGDREEEAARSGSTTPYALMAQEAGESAIGANGLVFLPYLAPGGERSPIWDPSARGVLFGLTLAHTRQDVLRAIFEASAYALRDNVDTIESQGIRVDKLRVSGGQNKSEFWRQLKANVTGKPIELTQYAEDATAFGASILARVGVGEFSSPEDVTSVIRVVESVAPEPHQHDLYTGYFHLYREVYQNLRGSYESLSELRG
jgi:xylulokinase